VVAGIVLVLVGLLAIGGTGGIILAVIGLAPLATGVFNICLLGPLFRLDLSGRPRSGAA
jgi:hypothetical protein